MDKKIQIQQLDKFDIELMYCLFINDKNSPIQSYRIKDIIDNTDLKASYYTYVNRIQKKLVQLNYIKEGFQEGNAHCYYITEFGTDFLKDNVLKNEDIFEEE